MAFCMSHAESTADLTCSFTLAVLYMMLFAFTAYLRLTQSLPRTTMLRAFGNAVLVGSFFRTLYFGVPDSAIHLKFVPTDYHHHTREWYFNGIQTAVFFAGNWCFYVLFGLIVLLWAQALFSTARQKIQRRPGQLFWMLVMMYAVVQVLLIALYFFADYHHILLVHSVCCILVFAALAIGFVVLWRKLSAALRPRLFSVSSTPTTFLVAEASRPADSAEHVAKMRKLTAIAVCGTVCSTFRVGAQFYQLYCVARDMTFHGSSWWLVLFIYYFLSELLSPCCLMLILKARRPVKGARPPTTSGLVSEDSDFDVEAPSPWDTDDDVPYVTPSRGGSIAVET